MQAYLYVVMGSAE